MPDDRETMVCKSHREFPDPSRSRLRDGTRPRLMQERANMCLNQTFPEQPSVSPAAALPKGKL